MENALKSDPPQKQSQVPVSAQQLLLKQPAFLPHRQKFIGQELFNDVVSRYSQCLDFQSNHSCMYAVVQSSQCKESTEKVDRKVEVLAYVQGICAWKGDVVLHLRHEPAFSQE